MTIEQVLTWVGLPAVGALIWLIRLEGRVNLNESRTNDMRSMLEDIQHDVKQLLQRRP